MCRLPRASPKAPWRESAAVAHTHRWRALRPRLPEDATPSPPRRHPLGGAGCLAALSMVELHALRYEDYEVPVLKMQLGGRRCGSWGSYGAANGLYCSRKCGSLSLISSFFTLLLVFNSFRASSLVSSGRHPSWLGRGWFSWGSHIGTGPAGHVRQPNASRLPRPRGRGAAHRTLAPHGSAWSSRFVACTIAIIWSELSAGLKEEGGGLREIRRRR